MIYLAIGFAANQYNQACCEIYCFNIACLLELIQVRLALCDILICLYNFESQLQMAIQFAIAASEGQKLNDNNVKTVANANPRPQLNNKGQPTTTSMDNISWLANKQLCDFVAKSKFVQNLPSVTTPTPPPRIGGTAAGQTWTANDAHSTK